MLPGFKQGKRDSNPHERFWRPAYCRCMIPLYSLFLTQKSEYFRIRSICLQNYTLKTSFHLSHILFPDLPSGHALDRLVTVSSMHCCTSTSALSTSSSSRGLTSFRYGRSYLEGGFTLRCLQRLSLPNLATQLCHWYDNWCTSGSSNPVLSY